MEWELVEDGYWKESRYVGPDGRVLGGVRGSVYDKGSGWSAHVRKPDGQHLGDFVTESQAKRAVEHYWQKKKQRK